MERELRGSRRAGRERQHTEKGGQAAWLRQGSKENNRGTKQSGPDTERN